MQKKIFFLLIITSMFPIIAMEQKEQEQKFFKAIEDGNVDEVKKLIAAGINIDMQDEDGNTPIIAAVKKSPLDMGIIDVILNEIPNTILTNKNKQNAESIAKDDLLKKIIPIRYQYMLYEQMALKPLNLTDIKGTFRNTTTKEFINSPNQNRNLLANAIKTKSEYIVGELINNRGADVNQVFRDGKTPLDIAYDKGNIAIVRLLIGKGAKSSEQQFFEAIIADKNVEEIAEFIRSRRVSVDEKDQDDNTALILAIGKGNIDLINKLLELGADITTKNTAGETALGLAIMKNNVDLVKTLLSRSKKLEIDDPVDKHGNTALMLAVKGVRDEGIIKAILEQVPDPSAAITYVNALSDNDFKTRMLEFLTKAQAQYNLYKAIYENKELLEIEPLITSAVTLKVPNEDRNPFVLASLRADASDVIKLLMQKGERAIVEINSHLRTGKTPLITAIDEDVALGVEALLGNGASPKFEGADGKTPLEIAQEQGRTKIVELLEKVIAKPVTTPPLDDKPLLSSLHNFMQSLGALEQKLTLKL